MKLSSLDQTIGGQSTDIEAEGTTLTERTHFEPGDHERYSHYVRKEKIVESAVLGTPVIALCGKTWVPGRDPEKFPICPICKEIYDGLRPEPSEPSDSNGNE
ncbi:MAG: hypothetical protein RLZZ400_396 [Actinomycetota bacterium]|jgi:hypothetical protein